MSTIVHHYPTCSVWIEPKTRQISIECKRCGVRSHNPTDVSERYCANCDRFHAGAESPPAIPQFFPLASEVRQPMQRRTMQLSRMLERSLTRIALIQIGLLVAISSAAWSVALEVWTLPVHAGGIIGTLALVLGLLTIGGLAWIVRRVQAWEAEAVMIIRATEESEADSLHQAAEAAAGEPIEAEPDDRLPIELELGVRLPPNMRDVVSRLPAELQAKWIQRNRQRIESGELRIGGNDGTNVPGADRGAASGSGKLTGGR